MAGGIAHYLQSFIDTGRFQWQVLAAQSVVSAFSGFMFAEFTIAIGLSLQAAFCAAGAGGYLGTRVMEIIVHRLSGEKL